MGRGRAMGKLSLLLLAGALGAIACGGTEKKEAARGGDARTEDAVESTELKGCSLVTKEEVAAALGSPVNDGEDQGLVGCSWKAQSGARVGLDVYAGNLISAGTCAAQKSLLSGRLEDVAGLGDSAVWASGGDLVVCAHHAVLKVDVDDTPDTPDQDREAATKVARAALGRL